MIGWNILLYQHRKGRRQGPNQSPRVLCRAGGPHNPVLPGQVADMETMRPLLAQTDKKTAVTLDRSRLLYLINVHYNGQRDTPSRSEPLSCFTMIQYAGGKLDEHVKSSRKTWIARHATLMFAYSRDFGSLEACCKTRKRILERIFDRRWGCEEGGI